MASLKKCPMRLPALEPTTLHVKTAVSFDRSIIIFKKLMQNVKGDESAETEVG